MSEWYYSDAQRQQHGPITSDALAALHAQGTLALATLVWREGMTRWRPWQEMMGEVLGEPAADASAGAPAAPTAPASTAADPFAGTAGNADDDGAYRPYALAEASPYAPPTAAVMSGNVAVQLGERVVYAGFWKRVAAYCIDSFLVGVVNYAVQLPLMLILGLSIGKAGDGVPSTASGILYFVISFVVSLGLPATYYAWMHASQYQATLGKMAVGIKVVGHQGSRLSFGLGVGRYFAFVLSSLTLGIGLLMAAFTERKQALHDVICNTEVVDKYAYTNTPELQQDNLGTVATVILILMGVFLLVMLLLIFGVIVAASSMH